MIIYRFTDTATVTRVNFRTCHHIKRNHVAFKYHLAALHLCSSPCQLLIDFLSLTDFLILNILHECSHLICGLLWLASITLRVIQTAACYQYWTPFNWQVVFHCMNVLHFVYPLDSRWISGLFLPCAYYEYCYPHLCVSFCMDICFHFSRVYLEAELLGQMVTLYLIVWGTARLCFTLSAPFHNPSSGWGIQFLYSLTNI